MNKKKKKKGSRLGEFTASKWLVFMIIPTLYLLILTVFVIKASLYTNEDAFVNFSESGDIDYKVYLKENNYYNTNYLGKNMQYISGLIDDIKMDFKYSMSSDSQLDYEYIYNINSELIIMDAVDSSKILYSKTKNLKNITNYQKVNDNFNINEQISINYDEYNSYVNSFKKDYGVSVKSKLVITMEVSLRANSEVLKDSYSKVTKLSIAIPMSEQTISIGVDTKDIESSGQLAKNYLSLIKRPVLFGTGIVVGLISLILLYVSLYTLLTSRIKPNVYKAVVNDILKNYDRAIVTTDTIKNINEKNYKVIRVDSINELLDAHDSTSQPILYQEIEKDNISEFVITSDDILYKYIIDREELELKERTKAEEKAKKMSDTLNSLRLFKKKEKKNNDSLSNDIDDNNN